MTDMKKVLADAGVPSERLEPTLAALTGLDRVEAERTRAKIEYWKQVIYVETHFNDMCIRTRWLALTVSATVLAAAAVALAQYPDATISIGGLLIHIGAVLILVASVVSAGLWRLDAGYYYKMLLASVGHAQKVEDDLKEILGELLDAGSLTTKIAAKVSEKTANGIVWLLYAAMTFVPLILAAAVHFGSPSREVGSLAQEDVPTLQVDLFLGWERDGVGESLAPPEPAEDPPQR